MRLIALLCNVVGHDWRPSTARAGSETCARCRLRRVLIPGA